MGGGLMQLVAYGAQDIYLTGNPQITFFKVVYRRHTNFSMESIQQTINGSPTASGNSTVIISRNGDLVYKLYVTSISSDKNIKNGSAIISEVELEIGGQRIDKHYQEWMNIWTELSTPESKAIGLKTMQGDIGSNGTGSTNGVGMVQIPLQFWFCRNPGLALPLIALQYHEVKLKFKWGTGEGMDEAIVMAEYIYLDTDERRRFAQVSHEYLIEQIQKDTYTAASGDHTLNFNHPVKELIWTSQDENTYAKAKLVLNGHDRFSAQEEEYFQLRQPYDYHTAIPSQNLPDSAQVASSGLPINVAEGVADISQGIGTSSLALTANEFNFVTINGETLVPTNGAVAVAGAVDSGILAILGTVACTSFPLNSIAVGDTHIVDIHPAGDFTPGISLVVGQLHERTIARVTGIYEDADETTSIPVDGTGPIKNGQTLSTLTTTLDAATALGSLYITYDVVVCTSTLKDDDRIRVTIIPKESRTSQMTNKINVYSFALKPEEHQPSGTCNFSRIDNAKLNFSATPTSAGNIYAVNYNVLRIMSGMGGLAYSN
jgi:hypothetical protein